MYKIRARRRSKQWSITVVALGCGAFRNNRSGAMGEIPARNNSNGEIRPPLLDTPEYQLHVLLALCVHCNQMRYLCSHLLAAVY